ncbi:MAG: dihydroorotase [Sphingobacteriales bacterium]|nr:MAG: dihydroorotase [Sphingobacteriales bacterium]
MNEVILRQVRIWHPTSARHGQQLDVRLRPDGSLTELTATAIPEGSTVYEWPDAELSIGWTDLFADYREPGQEHKETLASGTAAARAGGFTQVGVLPNTAPPADSKMAIETIRRAASGTGVTLLPYGALSQKTDGKALAEMLDMRTGGAVGFTDGWKSVQNSGLMLKALEYVKAFEGLIVQFPNDAALAQGGLMHEGLMSTRLGMAGIPAIAETMAVYRDIELLRYTGSRLHLSGISTAASVELIRRAKADGLQLTCSVTPYHLLLTDEALSGYDSSWKLTPPLRPDADRQALIAALADGTIDAVTSQHRPQDWDAKTKEFEYASEGLAVQELLFPLLLKAVGTQVPKDRVLEALTTGPRRVLGLPDMELEDSGSWTVFSTTGETLLSRTEAKSKAFNNPFLGQPLPGQVLRTFSA